MQWSHSKLFGCRKPLQDWSCKRNGVCAEPSDLGLLPASLHCWAQLINLNRMAYEGEDEHINTSFFSNGDAIESHHRALQGQFMTVLYVLLDIHSSTRICKEPSWLSWERWFKSSDWWQTVWTQQVLDLLLPWLCDLGQITLPLWAASLSVKRGWNKYLRHRAMAKVKGNTVQRHVNMQNIFAILLFNLCPLGLLFLVSGPWSHKEPAQGSEPWNEIDRVCISPLPAKMSSLLPLLDQGAKAAMKHDITTLLTPCGYRDPRFGTALERGLVLDE